jgi:hypothetical protein
LEFLFHGGLRDNRARRLLKENFQGENHPGAESRREADAKFA